MSLNNNSILLNNILDKVNSLPSISDYIKCNFTIIGDTIQPIDPTENMIWVNTSVPINKYYFTSTEPENMNEGDVWIHVGDTSKVAFDIINNVTIYPLSAYQYINNTLVNVVSNSYRNGEWVDWYIWLFKLGDQCNDITGGWRGDATIINNNRCMVFSGNLSRLTTNNTVIRGAATKLHINITKLIRTDDGLFSVTLYILDDNTSSTTTVAEIYCTTTGEKIIDISDITRPFYVFLCSEFNTAVEVDKIWMD